MNSHIGRDDLYATLGLNRDAPMSEIRKAYRRAAKKAHPDAGGSPEQFERLSRALAVLGDEKRRQHYDETGDDSAPEPDITEALARSTALGAIGDVMAAIDQKNADYDEFDLLGDAKRHLTTQRGAEAGQIKKAKKKIERLKKAAKKFRAKKGKVNLIGPMLENQATELARGVAKAERQQEMLKRALEILAEHEFEFEKKAAPSAAAQAMRYVQW